MMQLLYYNVVLRIHYTPQRAAWPPVDLSWERHAKKDGSSPPGMSSDPSRIAIIATINRRVIIATINRIAIIATINGIAIIATTSKIAIIATINGPLAG